MIADFLKSSQKTAKQVFGDQAAEFVRLFLGKMPVQIQHELSIIIKSEASVDNYLESLPICETHPANNRSPALQ